MNDIFVNIAKFYYNLPWFHNIYENSLNLFQILYQILTSLNNFLSFLFNPLDEKRNNIFEITNTMLFKHLFIFIYLYL